MTPSRYFLARCAQAFGYSRKSHRMTAAASEMHLLREAEAQLGFANWEKVESVEELSLEYWNLRKFIKEKDIVRKKLAECQARLDKAHEERTALLNSTPEVHQELSEKRTELLATVKTLSLKRDRVIADAREIRRSYDGFKMKLEVLTKESAGEASIQEVKARLVELRTKFSELKELRAEIGKEIGAIDAQLDLVDTEIKGKKVDRRVMSSGAFQVIGEGNKEISILRAESAVLDTQMRQLYADIGLYLSRNAGRNPACAKAVASHKGLVDVMMAIRRSIILNQRLGGSA